MKRWTPEDEVILCECWGTMTVAGLCKKLNRSKNAVMMKVNRLGLPPYLESGEYITMRQLILALGYSGSSDSYKIKSWIQNRGFPVRNKRHTKKVVRVVFLDEFWKWAEKNRSFLDFSKMEPLALGAEPEWVAEQRRKDFQAFAIQRKDPWTPEEDGRLKILVEQQRYGYAELSEMLRRSAGAIQRRCTDLSLKARPVKADNHGSTATWTKEDFDKLADGIRRGDSYTLIGKAIGKSEKAVRGKVYFVYLTESQDRVRAMMGDCSWGYGAPEPTVKQAVCLSRTKTEARKNLSALVGVLRYRMNQLGYDPYWQRFMCMNWDDIGGCSAGCADCDSCAEFRRIQPQYCARCGATFYERKENRFCSSCRQARKKQAQRHWCRVNAKVGG
ncbi:hypothetical protein [Anaerotruncus colihominis]|nr:hypothetical protein [Anaerotruncus colihominis]MCQ4735186.1 hypothetical protein [Anaerotruncus colihominis]UWN75715.1 hypothetical protein NQ528_03840 [Anaerotruncus colihominis]